jgi:mannose-6-phosphate isomerase-like protein (cupin superfamily)
MVRAGDSIANPVTGETVTFRRTSAESHGEVVIAEVALAGHGFVAGAHVHPKQTERFRILEGAVTFRVGDRRFTATAGETVVVEAGTPHAFSNAGSDTARFVCEIRPALGFERLLETMFALARDGKTNRRGLPHPLRLAAIAERHRDDIQLPIVPVSLQRLAATLGAGAAWAFTELGPIYDGVPSRPARVPRPAAATLHALPSRRTAQ